MLVVPTLSISGAAGGVWCLLCFLSPSLELLVLAVALYSTTPPTLTTILYYSLLLLLSTPKTITLLLVLLLYFMHDVDLM